jgi:hypothetical protein
MDTAGNQQTWKDFADEIIKRLKEHDTDNGTYYAYYLGQDTDGLNALATAIDKANKSLMWKEVKNDGSKSKK